MALFEPKWMSTKDREKAVAAVNDVKTQEELKQALTKAYFAEVKVIALRRMTDVDKLIEALEIKKNDIRFINETRMAFFEKIEKMSDDKGIMKKMAPYIVKYFPVVDTTYQWSGQDRNGQSQLRCSDILIGISKKHPEVIREHWSEFFTKYESWHQDVKPNHTDWRKYQSGSSDCHSDSGVHTDTGTKDHNDAKPGWSQMDRFPPYIRE